MSSHILKWLVLSLAGVVAAGCGGGTDSVGRQAISGTILMNGKPLDKGAINFHPQDTGKHIVGAGAVIENGKYSILPEQGLVAGKYSVAISSPEPTTQSAPASGQSSEDVMKTVAAAGVPKERLPAKYNSMTQLTAEVKSSGSNKFDFNVESATH